MQYCGTYRILVDGRYEDCEVHFSYEKMKYVASIENFKIPYGSMKTPDDITRYINEFIPEYREVCFDIPLKFAEGRVENESQRKQIPTDDNFVVYEGYYNEEIFIDPVFDNGYILKMANSFIPGTFVGFGSANVVVPDYPKHSIGSTYISPYSEDVADLVKEVREIVKRKVHVFVSGMLFRHKNRVVEVTPCYEYESNNLVFDYRIH